MGFNFVKFHNVLCWVFCLVLIVNASRIFRKTAAFYSCEAPIFFLKKTSTLVFQPPPPLLKFHDYICTSKCYHKLLALFSRSVHKSQSFRDFNQRDCHIRGSNRGPFVPHSHAPQTAYLARELTILRQI